MSPKGTVKLKVVDGRPRLFRDGQSRDFIAYCNCICGPDWRAWTDYFIGSGVRIHFVFPTAEYWVDEGVSKTDVPARRIITMDEMAEHILAREPDALFVVRFGSSPPEAWKKKNPGEMATVHGPRLGSEPSLASDKYIDGLRQYVKTVIDHCESRPWGPRVIAYISFPFGEGLTPLSLDEQFFDRSEAMTRAWRRWLREKYKTDAALRKAWGRDDVALDTVEVPTDAELRAKVDRLQHWPDAQDMRVERDYVLLQKVLFRRWIITLIDASHEATRKRPVLVGMDVMKQPLLGWEHNMAFYGRGLEHRGFSMFLSTGSIGVGDLLDNPRLECLMTPADYHARGVGFSWEGEGASDSLVLRGKTLIIENDARTFLHGEGPGGHSPLGAFMTLPEVRAGLLRNSAQCLSRGLLHYWMDVDGGWFNDDRIQREIRVDKRLLEAGLSRPHRETEHAIAMIIDDESPLYEDFTRGFQNLAVIRQRIEGLGLAGIPYRLYLLSDLQKKNFPRYRCYLFPNLFKVDRKTINLLKRKVLRDGSIAIFGPGTGITDGETVSAKQAEALLGIPMKLYPWKSQRTIRIRNRNHPALRAKGMPALFRESYAYGPILAPDPDRLAGSGAVVLGDAVFSFYVNAAGLVLKDFGRGASGNGKKGPRGEGDYAVVFCGAVPLPPELLRGLARYGGCNVWCDDDVVISASDSLLSIHSTEPGPYTLSLPGKFSKVTDALTGKLVAQNADSIEVKLSPPETRVFLLDR